MFGILHSISPRAAPVFPVWVGVEQWRGRGRVRGGRQETAPIHHPDPGSQGGEVIVMMMMIMIMIVMMMMIVMMVMIVMMM